MALKTDDLGVNYYYCFVLMMMAYDQCANILEISLNGDQQYQYFPITLICAIL